MAEAAGQPPRDYSNFSVVLLNSEDLIKERAACLPNGYYFMPVQDAEQYTLVVQGPDGWWFSPENLSVSTADGSCQPDQDINFNYTGFGVIGRVLGAVGGPSCAAKKDDGPQNVTVRLIPYKGCEEGDEACAAAAAEDTREEQTCPTDNRGLYAFGNLLPGVYIIEAEHDVYMINTTGKSELRKSITLNFDSAATADIFYAVGYDLTGSVVNQGSPVAGVQVFLYSDDVSVVHCPSGAGMAPAGHEAALCVAETAPDGKFVFPVVPCGKYTLVPHYQGEETIFDVKPTTLDVIVGHSSTVVAKPFQVTGFSLGGVVLDHAGTGVGGATVYIDSKRRTTTDSRGRYKLDQVSPTTQYTVTVSKSHYNFSSLDRITVKPSLVALPEIRATHYDICGKLLVKERAFKGSQQVRISGSSTDATKELELDEYGQAPFCFSVEPGIYKVSPAISGAHEEAGLAYNPRERTVEISSSPFLLANFSQGVTSISGTVECVDLCSPDVQVMLSRAGDSMPLKTVNLTEYSENFSFQGVKPGSYVVQIHKPVRGQFGIDGDNWCWKTSRHEVTMGPEDLTDLHFKQVGWVMRANVSHPVKKIPCLHDDLQPVFLDFERGLNEMCMKAPGSHMMLMMDLCLYFGALMIPYETDMPTVLQLQAKMHLLQGTIVVDSRITPDAGNLTDLLFPQFFKRNEIGYKSFVDLRNWARLRSRPNATNPYAVYEYAFWGDHGLDMVIRPYHDGRITDEYIALPGEDVPENTSEPESEPEPAPLESAASVEDNDEPAVVDSTMSTIDKAEDDDARPRHGVGERIPAPAKQSLKDFFREASIYSPAVLGKAADIDDIADMQKEGLNVGVEYPKPAEAPVQAPYLPEDEPLQQAPEEDEDPGWAETPYDPLDELPMRAKPLPPVEDTWPPRQRFLFYPAFRYASLLSDDCEPEILPFEARPGVYINGSVSPALEGVNISVITTTGSLNAGWVADEEVLWATSGPDGLFFAGPLYDDATYALKASKPGYLLKDLGGNSFQAEKLAEIIVVVVGGTAAEEPLPPVLLTLTGAGGFRKNTVSGEGGKLTVLDLFPGTMHLRPLLKEYKFSPETMSIKLGSGETKGVTFHANRVAYSALGNVTSLSGSPEAGMPVEARAVKGGYYETTETDVNGHFRLRGLIPGVPYSVQVVLKNGSEGSSRIERAAPKTLEVQVSEGANVEGLRFVVFDRAVGKTLTGLVEGGAGVRQWQPHLAVEVAHAADPSRVERTLPLPPSLFYEVQDLPRGKYIVRLSLSLPEKTHQLLHEPVEVDLQTDSLVHAAPLRFSVQEKGDNDGRCVTSPDGSRQCKW
eukprot:SM000043S15784  [mRNA]  locus=s43:149855:159159:+ [translate_table: standard]